MPLFSHLFGLKPWDMDRITYSEFEAYREFADGWTRGREDDSWPGT